MAKPKIYIDGKEGTTGLQIYDRLAKREDIELLLIDEAKRKDTEERRKLIHAADIVFLCLPDAAAVEAVALAEGSGARIIDASTAHRTAKGWAYGMAELSKEHREAIKTSSRVANPGCHATGFITSVYPLVAPEMQKVCGLDYPPVFSPIVDDYYKGMAVTIQLQNRLLNGEPTAEDIYEKLAGWYDGQKLIKVHPFGYDGMIAAADMAGRDSLQLIVNGHGEQTIVTALFDNLGKGASGAAVQNMNLMLGFEETAGLAL